MKAILPLFAVLALTGCAGQNSKPYRAPHVTVRGATVDDARSYYGVKCVEGNGRIETNTPQQLVCIKPFEGSFGEIMYQVLMTERYASTPETKVRFNFFQNRDATTISVDVYIEHQNGFGKVTKNYMRNGNLAAQIQSGLDDFKAHYEQPATPVAVSAGSSEANGVASAAGCGEPSMISSEEGRDLYESACPDKKLIIECWAGICRSLN